MQDVDIDIKQYASLIHIEGQIRINVGNLQLIQSFIQWIRDMVKIGREPSLVPFPSQEVAR